MKSFSGSCFSASLRKKERKKKRKRFFFGFCFFLKLLLKKKFDYGRVLRPLAPEVGPFLHRHTCVIGRIHYFVCNTAYLTLPRYQLLTPGENSADSKTSFYKDCSLGSVKSGPTTSPCLATDE